MKTLLIGKEDRYELYMPQDIPFAQNCEKVFCHPGTPEEEILKACPDAEYLATDPMVTVSGDLIRGLTKLRMIISEGVGYNNIDLGAAREQKILVCNCKGVNAPAVAEQTILLMLGYLRRITEGDRMEREGRQIEMKQDTMVHAPRELSNCSVGLIGFGDIARETAKRLAPFGCRLYYHSRTRRDPETEKAYQITYLPLEELTAACDIVSLHVAVTDETRNMVDKAFLARMKPDAFLVNTARGDLVDNEALREALIKGTIQGAALDTIAPEPTKADNPLIDLPASCAGRVLYSPHIGGITADAMRHSHRIVWQAFEDFSHGREPVHIVRESIPFCEAQIPGKERA